MIKNISIFVCIAIIVVLSFVILFPKWKQPKDTKQEQDTKQVAFYYRSGNLENNYNCKKDILDKILEKKNECLEKVLAPYDTQHAGEMEDWDTEDIEALVSLCNQQIITLYCYR